MPAASAAEGASIAATVRAQSKASQLAGAGYSMHLFSGQGRDESIASALARADAVLISIPPVAEREPVLEIYRHVLATAPQLHWIGYLSTIGVYGEHAGAWVDEATPPRPRGERSRRRLQAEQQWLEFGATTGVPVQLFRLAGILWPRPQPAGPARPGHGAAHRQAGPCLQPYSCRGHRPGRRGVACPSRAGAIDNVADDEPAPPQDVVAFAAALCGLAPPPEIPLEHAELTEMSRSFFRETKRGATG